MPRRRKEEDSSNEIPPKSATTKERLSMFIRSTLSSSHFRLQLCCQTYTTRLFISFRHVARLQTPDDEEERKKVEAQNGTHNSTTRLRLCFVLRRCVIAEMEMRRAFLCVSCAMHNGKIQTQMQPNKKMFFIIFPLYVLLVFIYLFAALDENDSERDECVGSFTRPLTLVRATKTLLRRLFLWFEIHCSSVLLLSVLFSTSTSAVDLCVRTLFMVRLVVCLPFVYAFMASLVTNSLSFETGSVLQFPRRYEIDTANL